MRNENGTLGYIYYFFFTIFNALGYMTAKVSYYYYPKLHPFQFVFLRSVWASLIIAILLNKDFYKITIKEVNKSSVGPLTFRSIQGTITNVINFACAKVLPLSIIGIVNNMAPVVTVGLAYVFLGERLTLIQFIFLLLSVGGILTIIIGGFH